MLYDVVFGHDSSNNIFSGPDKKCQFASIEMCFVWSYQRKNLKIKYGNSQLQIETTIFSMINSEPENEKGTFVNCFGIRFLRSCDYILN